jgi:hypothetical protein
MTVEFWCEYLLVNIRLEAREGNGTMILILMLGRVEGG